MLPVLALLAALAVAAPESGPYYLEGPVEVARPAAQSLVREAGALGFDGRVVRRYRHGGGWEFLARIGGFADEARATEAAKALADATGRSLAVYTTAEEAPVEVAAVHSTLPANDADPTAMSVAEMVDRMARAHGGSGGGASAIDAAERVLFRFRRTVPGGPVVEHTWARQGDDLYLQVDVIEGEGTSSRAWLVGGAAFLATGGKATSQDATRTSAILDQFSPDQTLGFPLKVASSVRSRPEFGLLRRDGTVDVDGTPCERLRYDGEQGSDAVTLAVDARRWLLRQVEMGSEAGPVVHRYRDYRDLGGGLVVPFDVRAWSGSTVVDEIQVLELDLAPRLPETWFQSPVL